MGAISSLNSTYINLVRRAKSEANDLVFSKLRGIQNYFPENFRCNLTYYEGDNFSDTFFHHIFESENFRIPFYSLRKIA